MNTRSTIRTVNELIGQAHQARLAHEENSDFGDGEFPIHLREYLRLVRHMFGHLPRERYRRLRRDGFNNMHYRENGSPHRVTFMGLALVPFPGAAKLP